MKERAPDAVEQQKTETPWSDSFGGTYYKAPKEREEEAIKFAKSIFAKFFVFGDQYGHHWDSSIFSIDFSKGPENVDLEVRLEPNGWEKKELPDGTENFSMSIQIRGGRLEVIPPEPNFFIHHRFVFSDIAFIIGEHHISLEELSPGVKVEMIDCRDGESWNPDLRTIHLNHISDLGDVFSFFHEVGHSIDERKRGIKGWRQDDKMHRGLSERNAWAEALRITRKYGIPVSDFFLKKKMQDYLRSHERDVNKPISGESRKKLRYKKATSKY